MPGQGFHIALTDMVVRNLGLEANHQLMAGALAVDALKIYTPQRDSSHFYNGRYCVFPQLEELRSLSAVEVGELENEIAHMLYYTEVMLFEEFSKHIPESPYKMGIRIHLITDAVCNKYIRDCIIDNSRLKSEGLIIQRSTGEAMPLKEYYSRLYKAYPIMDTYALKKAGITLEQLSEIKEYISKNMNSEMSEWLNSFIKLETEENESNFITSCNIEEMISLTVQKTSDYIKKFL